jgi:zinc D-Ala-D-Ala carboxypeptidase
VTLTPHFSFEELTRTGQSALQDKNRQEAQAYLPRLKALAEMLEVIRAKFGPVKVTSAFRGPSVNAAVGGSKSSQHLVGEAADIGCGVSDEELHKWIVTESGLKFGQCILEKPPGKSWVHISLGAPYRDPKRCGESLYFDGKTYTPKKY